MNIYFSPQRSDADLVVSKNGDTLTINGEAVNFAVVPEGATLPAAAISTPGFMGVVTRVNGSINVTLVLPHKPTPSTARAAPAPILNAADGPVELPA